MKVSLRAGLEHPTVDELQTALELDPSSEVHCLAFMAKKKTCNEILNDPLGERDRILAEICGEMTRNGLSVASDRVTELLEDLAQTLICTKKRHKVKKGKFDCNQVEHVAEILQGRLEALEEARNASRRKAQARIRYKSRADKNGTSARKAKGRQSAVLVTELNVGSTENEGDSDSSGDNSEPSGLDESTTTLAHRPNPFIHHLAAIKAHAYVKPATRTPNPVRRRQRRSGGDHLASDESDAPTPGTALSDIFTPVSPASSETPFESTIRSFPRAQAWRRERNETPSRRRRVSDAAEDEPDPDADYLEEDSESDGSASSSSSSSQIADSEHSEPEAISTQGEDDGQSQHGHSDEETPSQPEVIMAFRSGKYEGKNTVNHVLKLMRSAIQQAPPGYVYCFSDENVKGYLKIGFAGIKDIEKEQPGVKLPIKSRNTRSRLWKRLAEQENDCKFTMKLEYDTYMPCAVGKMEALIHATLYAQRREIITCRTQTCNVRHNEWFYVSLDEAIRAIEAWKGFSVLRPWADNGVFKTKWANYAANNVKQKTFANITIETWMYGAWKDFVDEATLQQSRLRQEKKLKANIERLEEERVQAEKNTDEKKELVNQLQLEGAEMQLRKAERKQRRLSEQLRQGKRQLERLKKPLRKSLG